MTLSERLKEIREKSNFTLKKAAVFCKTKVEYLEWIESGQYEKLPAPVYTQGFLKKYLQLLKINEEDILTEFQREYETASLLKDKKMRQIHSSRQPKIIVTPKNISWLVVIIAFLAIFGYLIYELTSLTGPPKLILNYPAQDITISGQSSIKIEGISDPSAKLTINDSQVYIEKDGRFLQKVDLSPGQNAIDIKAENRFGKKSEIIRQVIAE